MLITIKHNTHAQQCANDFDGFKASVRDKLHWRVVQEHPDRLHALSSSQRARGLDTHVDKHGFTMPRRGRTVPPQSVSAPAPVSLSENAFQMLQRDVTLAGAEGFVAESSRPQPPPLHAGSGPRAPQVPRRTPATARQARRSSTPAEFIATWNVYGVGGASGLSKLHGIAHVMQQHGIGALAVQETKMSPSADLPVQASLTFRGEKESRGLDGHKCRGIGFLLRHSHEAAFTYLGACKTLIDGYGAVWGCWAGHTPEDDIYVASVCLPDIGRGNREPLLYQQVLDQIKGAYHEYAAKPGTIRILGDMNARVGHRDSPRVPAHLKPYAPAFGEDMVNQHGLKLLQFCSDLDLQIVSGYTPIGREATFMRANVSTVIDFALVPRAGLSPSTHACYTIPCDNPELTGVGSDHAPLLLHCPARTAAAPKRASTVTPICYEQVWDEDKREHYHELLAEAARELRAMLCPPNVTAGDQRAADGAAQAVASALTSAATRAFGTRTVVHRIHKRWMNHDVAELCDRRRQAHAEFARDRSAANAAALKAASATAREACRTAQREYKARRENNAQTRWVDNPGSRDAWKLLRDLDNPASVSSVDALVHPDTAALCKDTGDKLHALSSHFQTLLTPATPRSPLEGTQRERSAAHVTALRQHTVGHTEGLDTPFTMREVQSALGKLHNHKAPGKDGMQAELLKYSGRIGAQMLTDLYNVVHKAERMPSGWRDGVMVPLPKSGDLTDCNNYRGLTLMPALKKVFSQVMVARLTTHVPLHDHQYGFRKGRSTLDALFALHAAVEPRVQSGLVSCLLFLDWSKAYDRVMHDAFLDRLAHKGVTGKA